MDKLIKFASDCGYTLSEIITNGEIHRFKTSESDHKNSGAYLFFSNYTIKDNKQYFAGWIGDWSNQVWNKYKSNFRLTDEDMQRSKELIEEASRKLIREKLDTNEKVAIEALNKWNSLPEGMSAYHIKKSFDQPYGAKLMNNIAVLNLYDIHGKTWSLQYITPDSKRFKSRGRIQGCFHTVGGEPGDTVYITEGYATAVSCHIAVGQPVTYALDSGNIHRVAMAFFEKYPDKRIIILGDDDHTSDKNIGRTKATEAAKSCMGFAIFPKFKQLDGRNTTDFNDLHRVEGIEAVRDQILGFEEPSTSESHEYGIKLLGCLDNKFYYSVKQTKEIIGLKASDHSKTNLIAMCPWSYWEDKFGGVDEETGEVSFCLSLLFSKQRKIGAFTDDKMRGTGLWMDEKRVIINMGQKLIVNGIETDDFKTKFFYETKQKTDINLRETATQDDLDTIHEIFSHFKYKNWGDRRYLIGSLNYLNIFNLLHWKPSLWIIGERGCGKSEIQDFIRSKFFSHFQGGSIQDTTGAGLKQYVRHDSKPLFIDEMETNSIQSEKRAREVIELIRQSAYGGDTFSLRGTSSGSSVSTKLNSVFILASIKPTFITSADETRFKIVEMIRNDKIPWETLKIKMNGLDPLIGKRLFAYSIKTFDKYSNILNQCHKFINQKLDIESRTADTISPFVAGYLNMFDDELEETCTKAVKCYNNDPIEDAAPNDSDELLNTILMSRVNNAERSTVAELINESKSSTCYDLSADKELFRSGIKYFKPERQLAIQCRNGEILSMLRNTPFSGRYSIILKRHKSYMETKQVRFHDVTAKSIVLDYMRIQ